MLLYNNHSIAEDEEHDLNLGIIYMESLLKLHTCDFSTYAAQTILMENQGLLDHLATAKESCHLNFIVVIFKV